MPNPRPQTIQTNPKPNANTVSKCPGNEVTHNAAALLLSMRIIYTLNLSPQPLLARLRQKTTVIPVFDNEISDRDTNKPLFGKVLLKTCLAAVCASSPELLGNPKRDYSIYIVDPLENIAGLSVGAGLLSWWLKNDRPPFCNEDENSNEYAVGKIVRDRGLESLEIVMSLKETAPQSVEDHAKSLSYLRLPSSHPERPEKTHPSIELPPGARKPTIKPCKDSSKTRIGRPAGATTNPEKKAHRAAVLEQKETLKKLQNLAKMQKGEPYDPILITPSDMNARKVTDEDIERQQKIVEELESRPVITPQTTSFLTTKPLPNRAGNASTSFTMFKNAVDNPSNANNKSSPTSQPSTSTSQSSVPITADPGVIQNAEILQSLLTSMLGKIDFPSAKPTVKGKETDLANYINPALVASLRQLLPLFTASSLFCPPEFNHLPSMLHSSPRQPHTGHVPVSAYTSGISQKLFQTADETFRISNTSSFERAEVVPNTINHYSHAKSDPPKVREDAHPVPGGGWARGRNLIPRKPVPSSAPLSDRQAGQPSTNASSSPGRDTSVDKENKPPPNMSQNAKRGSAVFQDKENSNGFSKPITKKRKLERKSSQGEDVKIIGTSREGSTVTDATQNTTNIISHIVSSPLRSSSNQTRTMSEPISQGPSAPLIATADFPIPEPPRTPPRKDNTTNSNQKSLFTPATPANTAVRSNRLYAGTSLFTPSPVRVRSQDQSLGNSIRHSAAVDSEPFTMKPGWDLPPSSPPPLTSPILSPKDMTVRDKLELSGHTETRDNMDREGLRQVPSPTALFPSSTLSSEMEVLSEGDIGAASESTEPTLTDIELDIDELWNSLGPIIIQAQVESTNLIDPSSDNLDSDCKFSHVFPESQNGVDAAKLAEDLKALFGGCVV